MGAAPANILLRDVDYHLEDTARGHWRRFVYPNGSRFAEFTSHQSWGSMPLVHYTYGKCPQTGKRITARGVIAVGRVAVGLLAIGQMAVGIVAIGQLAIGLILGLGQAASGAVAIGQAAAAMLFAAGQFATGQVAIGQFAFGHYALAQYGLGDFVWDVRTADPAARKFFLGLVGK